jgi:hypothetical protein
MHLSLLLRIPSPEKNAGTLLSTGSDLFERLRVMPGSSLQFLRTNKSNGHLGAWTDVSGKQIEPVESVCQLSKAHSNIQSNSIKGRIALRQRFSLRKWSNCEG